MSDEQRRDTQATKPPKSTESPQKDVVAKGSDKQISKKATTKKSKKPAAEKAGSKDTKDEETKAKTSKGKTAKSKTSGSKASKGATTVAQVMTDAVHRVHSTASLNEAAQQMWDHDIGVVPVVDMEGRVTGLVTDRDIAMAAYLQGRLLQNLGVQEVMSTQVRTARPYQPVSEAASMMAKHQIRRLPVVDDEGNLAGMLSMKDLAEASGDAISEDEVAATLRAICAPHRDSSKAAEEATST